MLQVSSETVYPDEKFKDWVLIFHEYLIGQDLWLKCEGGWIIWNQNKGFSPKHKTFSIDVYLMTGLEDEWPVMDDFQTIFLMSCWTWMDGIFDHIICRKMGRWIIGGGWVHYRCSGGFSRLLAGTTERPASTKLLVEIGTNIVEASIEEYEDGCCE